MKSFIYLSLGLLLAGFAFSFFLLFEGNNDRVLSWWQHFSRKSESLPFSPYKVRKVGISDLRTEPANEVVFLDQHLFWKGRGAKAKPAVDKEGTVKGFVIVDGGNGYSSLVRAKVIGAGADAFSLKPPVVQNGMITSLSVNKSSVWHNEPMTYALEEQHPFSGTAISTYPSGQIIEQRPFLDGQLHGKVCKWSPKGIQLASMEYKRGKKHGTHIFWYEKVEEPDDYKPKKSPNEEIIPTLWIELQERAKEKFKAGFGGHESNQWVNFNYRNRGGDFPVRLLEHWHENLMHGLFEGFDELGNKTFKDEYKYGLRIKHKIFDKTKL